jgi:hypothetical protein
MRKLYSKIYAKSPLILKQVLKKASFFVLRKPTVQKVNVPLQKRFPGNEEGGIVLSADFELAWAWRYARGIKNPLKKALEIAQNARRNFPYLLKTLDDCNIPVTWAIVGHLFLCNCKKGSHDWMRRISYFENENWIYNKGDWFECDPYSNWEKAKDWYAPDLIEKILSSKTKHEIGCHTFSHIDCSYKNCPPGVIDDEINACTEAAKLYNIKLRSFVFPGGTLGNYEILKKYGFLIYRKKTGYELGYPFKDRNDLIILPSGLGLGNNNLGWSKEYFMKFIKRYIHKAMNTGTICHFWFHPSIDQWFLNNVFPELMRYASEKRDEGKLWIGTMNNAARLLDEV